SRLLQALRKCGEPGLTFRIVRGEIHAHANPAHALALLRTHRKRPRGRAAEQRDKLAAFHSITSSAVGSCLSGRCLTKSASCSIEQCGNWLLGFGLTINLCTRPCWQTAPLRASAHWLESFR